MTETVAYRIRVLTFPSWDILYSVEWMMNGIEKSWPTHVIFPACVRSDWEIITKKFGQISRCPVRNSNPCHLEYKSGLLSLDQPVRLPDRVEWYLHCDGFLRNARYGCGAPSAPSAVVHFSNHIPPKADLPREQTERVWNWCLDNGQERKGTVNSVHPIEHICLPAPWFLWAFVPLCHSLCWT
jgi:hypothetical protein